MRSTARKPLLAGGEQQMRQTLGARQPWRARTGHERRARRACRLRRWERAIRQQAAAGFLPVLGERLLRLGDRRTAEADVGIAPLVLRAPVAEPGVTDPEAAGDRRLSVGDDDLAVIPRQDLLAGQRPEYAHLAAGAGQRLAQLLFEGAAPERVDEDPALGRWVASRERRDHPLRGAPRLPDVHEDVNARTRRADLLRDRIEDGAVVDPLEACDRVSSVRRGSDTRPRRTTRRPATTRCRGESHLARSPPTSTPLRSPAAPRRTPRRRATRGERTGGTMFVPCSKVRPSAPRCIPPPRARRRGATWPPPPFMRAPRVRARGSSRIRTSMDSHGRGGRQSSSVGSIPLPRRPTRSRRAPHPRARSSSMSRR